MRPVASSCSAGLTINGLGGTDGVFVQSAAKVHVDNCIVTGFSNDGIKVNGPTEMSIIDSAARDNLAAGIEIVGANTTIERVHSVGTVQGIIVSGSANVTIHKSVISSTTLASGSNFIRQRPPPPHMLQSANR